MKHLPLILLTFFVLPQTLTAESTLSLGIQPGYEGRGGSGAYLGEWTLGVFLPLAQKTGGEVTPELHLRLLTERDPGDTSGIIRNDWYRMGLKGGAGYYLPFGAAGPATFLFGLRGLAGLDFGPFGKDAELYDYYLGWNLSLHVPLVLDLALTPRLTLRLSHPTVSFSYESLTTKLGQVETSECWTSLKTALSGFSPSLGFYWRF